MRVEKDLRDVRHDAHTALPDASPILSTDPTASSYLTAFGARVALALHFELTREILPTTGGIFVRRLSTTGRKSAASSPPSNAARCRRAITCACPGRLPSSDCTDTPTQPYNEPLAERCAELLAIFDKYGVQRSQGSGAPDTIYVGAGIDCRNGRHVQGIQGMEDLLQRNKIPYPPA
jgi:hypothetical protein